MNAAIQTLEEIGQNATLKQHDDLLDMLSSLDIRKDLVESVKLKEFVCALVPEDDEGEGESE